MIHCNVSRAQAFLPDNWLAGRLAALKQAAAWLEDGTGAGGDFTGWVNLPAASLAGEELGRIKEAARKIQEQSQVLVVIGIGGSYLGARAVYELLRERQQEGGAEKNSFPNTKASGAYSPLSGKNSATTLSSSGRSANFSASPQYPAVAPPSLRRQGTDAEKCTRIRFSPKKFFSRYIYE